MELVTREQACTRLAGSEELTATAGQRLVIETSPQGVEVLDATVPKGKRWAVIVTVSIEETDA